MCTGSHVALEDLLPRVGLAEGETAVAYVARATEAGHVVHWPARTESPNGLSWPGLRPSRSGRVT